MRNQTLIGLCVFAFGLFMAWELGGKIVANDMNSIAFVALAFVAVGCRNQDSAQLASGLLFFPHLAPVRRLGPQISRQQHGDLFRQGRLGWANLHRAVCGHSARPCSDFSSTLSLVPLPLPMARNRSNLQL